MASARIKDSTMTYTQLLISFLLLIDRTLIVFGNETNSSRRCCPTGSVLILKEKIYSCESAPRNGPEFFERFISGTEGLPDCQNNTDLKIIPLADFYPKNFPQKDFCTDLFSHSYQENRYSVNDTFEIVILFCENSAKENSEREIESAIPTLLKIRRCCPKGEIFQIENRACLPSDHPEEDISTLSLIQNIGSSDFIYAIRGPPKCQHVIVDYEVNSTDVSFVNGRLQVTTSSSNGVLDLLTTEETSCLDEGSSPGRLVLRTCRGDDFCERHPCLRKCCPENQALVNNTCQNLPSHLTLSKWHSEVWDLPRTTGNTTKEIMNTTEYGLLLGNPCLYHVYPVFRDEGWFLVSEGNVHVPGYKTYEHHQYCTDMFYNHSLLEDGFYPFICFEDPPAEDNSVKTRFRVNAALLLVSCTFLLITLFVYICLPTLQNLHGKTLMCHVASLFMAFACLVMVAIATPKDEKILPDDTILNSDSLCKFLGYTMFFSFLSAFFWLNVMCFDIWWKFGSLRHSGKTNTKRRDDLKRFLSYCIYAWGLALLFVIGAVIADYVEFLPKNLQPHMGVDRCWFSIDQAVYGEVIFFTGPISIQLVVNLAFFILTARKCNMVKADIQRRVMVNRSDPRARRFESDKTKLILNVKLFVVMGISWVMEIISYFLSNYATNLQGRTEFFYVSDVVNCLQGLLIFILFALKKKVFLALRRKFTNRGNRRANAGGITDPYRVKKSPSSSTILSTFAVSSSP